VTSAADPGRTNTERIELWTIADPVSVCATQKEALEREPRLTQDEANVLLAYASGQIQDEEDAETLRLAESAMTKLRAALRVGEPPDA
jgi:hypothetical protein